MNEIVEDSLHRKIFHSYDHHILHEEGPDQENRKQREREHSVLEGKDRQFCFVQIVHGIIDALWVCLKIYFV